MRRSKCENILVFISFMKSRLLKGRPMRNFPFQTSCFYQIRGKRNFSRVFSLRKVFSHVHISHRGKSCFECQHYGEDGNIISIRSLTRHVLRHVRRKQQRFFVRDLHLTLCIALYFYFTPGLKPLVGWWPSQAVKGTSY